MTEGERAGMGIVPQGWSSVSYVLNEHIGLTRLGAMRRMGSRLVINVPSTVQRACALIPCT